MAGYYRRLAEAHLAPLWESMSALAPFEPRPRAAPHLWPWAHARAHLLKAGELITAEEAERRVVVLANPGLGDRLQATDTLYAGLQLILPGETAPPHRHSQWALRFVMEGEGAWTSVDGARIEMKPGDFVITPAWTWHAHGCEGASPVIWMDGLDVPLVGFLGAGFREEPAAGQVPGDSAWTGAVHYPYAPARAAARAADLDPHLGRVHRYGRGGAWAMPTLGPVLRLLPAGFATRRYRSTDGVVAAVVEGRVIAEIGDRTIEAGPGDVLAVPGWSFHTLCAVQETVLFAFSDRPVHEALGLFREERA